MREKRGRIRRGGGKGYGKAREKQNVVRRR